MFIVGLTRLASPVDEEAPRLAADLGLTTFEVRQALLPGLPAVILATPDRARALEIGARLLARGHDASVFDSRALVRSGGARSLRRFHLEGSAVVADAPAGPQRLPFGDIAVLLRVSQEFRSEITEQETVKKFSASAALISGGVKISKKVKVDRTTHYRDVQQALYVFLHQGPPPWILPEIGTSYQALGDRMVQSERQNFQSTIDVLRSAAPHAVYDDRLVRYRVPEWVRVVASHTGEGVAGAESSEDPGVDLLAHLLALWLSKESGRR